MNIAIAHDDMRNILYIIESITRRIIFTVEFPRSSILLVMFPLSVLLKNIYCFFSISVKHLVTIFLYNIEDSFTFHMKENVFCMISNIITIIVILIPDLYKLFINCSSVTLSKLSIKIFIPYARVLSYKEKIKTNDTKMKNNVLLSCSDLRMNFIVSFVVSCISLS